MADSVHRADSIKASKTKSKTKTKSP
jgi:hypothetical protein